MQNGCKSLFDEEVRNVEKNDQNKENGAESIERIAGQSLNELAKKIVMFLEEKFSSPSREEMSAVCDSAIELFSTIGGKVR